MKQVKFQWLDKIEYKKALILQNKIHEKVLQEKIPSQILFLEHPSVITLGYRQEEKIIHPNIPIVKTTRGGLTTLHNEGQLVCYPIINFNIFKIRPKNFIKLLEESIISTLNIYNIKASRKQKYPGIWINNKKIAFIGIKIKNRCSLHGFSLNVNNKLKDFNFFIPCGIQNVKLTSMCKLLKNKICLLKLANNLYYFLKSNLTLY